MVDQLKQQKQLLNKFWSEVRIKPIFIESKDTTHQKTRIVMDDCWFEISSLMSDKILKARRINSIFLNVSVCLTEIHDLDYDLAILWAEYIQDFLQYYLDVAVENELFETATNIRNFLQK